MLSQILLIVGVIVLFCIWVTQAKGTWQYYSQTGKLSLKRMGKGLLVVLLATACFLIFAFIVLRFLK